MADHNLLTWYTHPGTGEKIYTRPPEPGDSPAFEIGIGNYTEVHSGIMDFIHAVSPLLSLLPFKVVYTQYAEGFRLVFGFRRDGRKLIVSHFVASDALANAVQSALVAITVDHINGQLARPPEEIQTAEYHFYNLRGEEVDSPLR